MKPDAIYSGSGNIFVMVDGRFSKEDAAVSSQRDGLSSDEVVRLCAAYSSDGLVVLMEDDDADFRMEFYNPDASCGMMCGNGGRCIAAFASALGIKPSGADGLYRFAAPDGIHTAKVWPDGRVKLSLRNVNSVKALEGGGFFINTGAPHRIVFVEDVLSVDVLSEGRRLRNSLPDSPLGTNVDFVKVIGESALEIRTFEKGVEAETAACGTGITAAALALWASRGCPQGDATVSVKALEESLEVSFRCTGRSFTEIYLTGYVKIKNPS